jgi:hypothetical protein
MSPALTAVVPDTHAGMANNAPPVVLQSTRASVAVAASEPAIASDAKPQRTMVDRLAKQSTNETTHFMTSPSLG